MQNILEEHCFPHTTWFSEIVLPEFAGDDFPDIPEMEEIKRKIDLFMDNWQTVESKIKQSSLVQLVVLEVAEQTPESLLNQTVLVMESKWYCLCDAHLTSWEGFWRACKMNILECRGHSQFCITHMKWERAMLCSVGELESTLEPLRHWGEPIYIWKNLSYLKKYIWL